MQCLLIFHSLQGGTGSGVCRLLAESLSVSYPKIHIFQHKIMDSHSHYSQPKIYNTVFSISNILEHFETNSLSIMFDNAAIRNICSRNLLVQAPSLANVNTIISQWVSSFTALLRFRTYSERNTQLLYSKLVQPYSSFRLMLPSYSPLIPSKMPFYERQSLQNIGINCFEPANTTVLCDPRCGKYIVAFFGLRGDIDINHISPMRKAIKNRKIIQYVERAGTSMIQVTNQYPVELAGDCLTATKQSCCGLSNNTAFRQVVDRIIYKFDSHFRSKNGLDSYIDEGMEVDNFIEARERLYWLSADYAQCEEQPD